MSKTTEVVDLSKEQTSSAYGVCYASGTIFKPTKEGSSSFVVEVGKRRLVSRVLCITGFYKHRCTTCPFSQGELNFISRGPADG